MIKLLQMNRARRRVALDTREPWTSIYVRNPSRNVLDKYIEWLQISEKSRKTSLIDFELESGGGALTELVLSEVARVLHSIRDLAVNPKKSHVDNFATQDSGGSIRLLRNIICTHGNLPLERIHVKLSKDIPTKRRKNLSEIWEHLSSFPNIQQIKWDYHMMVLSPTNSWRAANLTVVEVRWLQCSDLYWIMSACPGLEELKMTSIASDHIPVNLDQMPIVEHRHLKFLKLFRWKPLPPIFTMITSPFLEKLYLSYIATTSSTQVFEDFIRRSKPPLRVFSYEQRHRFSEPTSERHDQNVGYLNICSTYFGGTMEHFGLMENVTPGIIKMLMERLPDGTHKHIPNMRYLDLCVNDIQGGLVSDPIFSLSVIYHEVPRAFRMTKGSRGRMAGITLRRNSDYGIGGQERFKAMAREGVWITKLAC